MTKRQLRQLYTQKRQQLMAVEYDILNQLLLEQFKQINLDNIHYIHLFLPMLEHKEPDTFLLRNWLQGRYPRITRVFPKADFADNTMRSFADNENLRLSTNKLGIPEPIEGTVIEETSIDLIVVPLLAFDRRGYRVGYGKGFYDRFIARCRKNVQLIGVSFFDPVDRINDLHEFDLPLHQCITPAKIWRFV